MPSDPTLTDAAQALLDATDRLPLEQHTLVFHEILALRAALAAASPPAAADDANMRCPKCGSTNVECVEKPHHNHICHDCGHSLLGSDYPVAIDPYCREAPDA